MPWKTIKMNADSYFVVVQILKCVLHAAYIYFTDTTIISKKLHKINKKIGKIGVWRPFSTSDENVTHRRNFLFIVC